MKRDSVVGVARVLDAMQAQLVAHVGDGVRLRVLALLLNQGPVVGLLVLGPKESDLRRINFFC